MRLVGRRGGVVVVGHETGRQSVQATVRSGRDEYHRHSGDPAVLRGTGRPADRGQL